MSEKFILTNEPYFHRISMFVGGYINSFTFFTNNGFMANNQTSNISKVGIYISKLDFGKVLIAILPIIFFFLGSLFINFIKLTIADKNKWILGILGLEVFSFFIMGIKSQPSPALDTLIKYYCCFLSAIHLSALRNLKKETLNSTICTGNIRTSGELFANALHSRKREDRNTALLYFFTLQFFPLGCFICITLSSILGNKTIWLSSLLATVQLFLMKNSLKEENNV